MVKNIGIPASEYGPQLLPMHVWSSQDMSSLLKCLKTGTGARRDCNSYFCHVCPCNSKDILFFTVGENRCDRCKVKEKEKCYHWDVGDEESIDKFQQMLDREINKYLDNMGATLDEVMKATKIKYKPNAVDKHSDVKNIDFISSGSNDDDIDALFYFSSLVTEELKLRNMPIIGSLEERREALRNQLVLEEKLLLIKQAIDRSELGKAAALLLIKQAIPCIMHMENSGRGKNFDDATFHRSQLVPKKKNCSQH
jgi:hypothetical protein